MIGAMGTYISRDVEPVLLELLEQFPAVAVTGPRQVGKSTLLQQVLPQARYLTLDDPFLRQRALDDPELLLEADGRQLIIDEIQYAPSLLSYIKMRIDRDRDRMGAFILTGSQQFPMLKGLGESLAGRIGLLELLPFSMAESERAGSPPDGLGAFERACLRGCFPEPLLRGRVDVARWYASYVQTYLERDIRAIYDIGHLREFERCLRLLAARCSQELHLSSVAAEVGVSAPTIRKWVSVLEASRLIYLLPPYHRNLGKRTIKAPKLYFLDVGLVCYLTGIRDFGHVMDGPLAGPLFENFGIQEAVKVSLSQGVQPRFYFLRTQAGLEVDLLVEGVNGRLRPFEFKLARTPRQNMADALRRFQDQFAALGAEPGQVVTLGEQSGPLTREVGLLSLRGFAAQVTDLARV